MSDNKDNSGITITEYEDGDLPDSMAPAADVPVIPENETAEEKYKREKLAEIAERKAQEVFVKRETGRWECQACGYVYSVEKGYAKYAVAPGTPFDMIEKFRCPQCGANKKYFIAETETLSGFKVRACMRVCMRVHACARRGCACALLFSGAPPSIALRSPVRKPEWCACGLPCPPPLPLSPLTPPDPISLSPSTAGEPEVRHRDELAHRRAEGQPHLRRLVLGLPRLHVGLHAGVTTEVGARERGGREGWGGRVFMSGNLLKSRSVGAVPRGMVLG